MLQNFFGVTLVQMRHNFSVVVESLPRIQHRSPRATYISDICAVSLEMLEVAALAIFVFPILLPTDRFTLRKVRQVCQPNVACVLPRRW